MVGHHHPRVERRAGWRRRAAGAPILRALEPALALGALDQVIAAAEPLAVAGQQQDVDRWVEVGALDAPLELGHQRAVDPVAALGAGRA